MNRAQRPDKTSSQSAAPARRGLWQRLLRWTVRVVGAVGALVVVLLILLEMDPVLSASTKWALRTFNPFIGAEMRVGGVSGGLLSGLRANDFRLTGNNGEPFASAEEIKGRINLLALLNGNVSLSGVRIVRPRVFATQQADSSWDLANLLPPDTTADAETRLSINGLHIDDGSLTARFFSPGRDSTLRVNDFWLSLRRFATGSDTEFAVDTARADFSPPGSIDTVSVALAISLQDDVLTLPGIRIASTASDVRGHGRLFFPGPATDFEDLDFTLEARPLVLRDIQPFLPAVNPLATVTGSVRATGSSRLIEFTARADLGDGAFADVAGSMTPPGTEVITYRIDVALNALSTDYLVRLGSPGTRLTGSLGLELKGPSVDSLSGSADLELEPFRFDRHRIAATKARSAFKDGNVSVKASTAINAARLEASGIGRPLDEIPAYEGSISFAGVDLRNFAADAEMSTSLSGRLDVSGRGFDPATAAARSILTLFRSHINQVPIDGARLAADIENGTAQANAEATIGRGRIHARGRVGLGDDQSFSLSTLLVEDVDFAAIVGDTVRSSVTARLSGSGSGFTPATMRLNAQGSVTASRYGIYEVERADVGLELRNGRLAVNADAALRGGSAAFAAVARPFDRQPSIEITDGQFAGVNLAQLTGTETWDTDLNGTLSANVRYAENASRAVIRLLLNDSRVNRQPVKSGAVDATLDRGSLSVSLDVDTPKGSFDLTGTGRPFDTSAQFAIDSGSFRQIDVGRILDQADMASSLNGTFRFSWTGSQVETIAGSGQIDVAASSYNLASITSGTVSVAADSGRFDVNGDLAFDRGNISLGGYAHLSANDPFELEAALDNVDIAALMADSLSSEVNVSFAIRGEGLFDPNRSGSGRLLTGSRSHYGPVEIHSARSGFALGNGLLRVDTIAVSSNIASVTGGGVVTLTSDSTAPSSNLSVHADILDLKPLHAFLPLDQRILLDGSVDLVFTGEPADLRFRADGKLFRIVHDDLRIGDIRIRGIGEFDEQRRLAVAEGRIDVNQISLPNFSARDLRLEASYADSSITYEGVATVDDRRDARVRGGVDLHGESPILTIAALTARLDRERWELLQPSTISFGDEYRIQNFLLFSQSQQIAVDGYIDLDGDQSLVMTIEQFRIGSIADLFDYRGLDGTLNGYIDLTGPAESPNILGSLTADIRSLGKPVGDLSTDLDYSDFRLNISGRIRNEDGSTITLDGFLPVNLALVAPTDSAGVREARRAPTEGEAGLTIRSDNFAIDWILPFLDKTLIDKVGGRLTGQTDVRGTFSEPVLEGSATVKAGILGLAEFGVTFREIEADIEFKDRQIVVNHLQARSGGGEAIAHGTVSLSALNLGDFDIDLSSENFLAVDNRFYRGVAAADMKLTGTTKRPRLEGSVDVVSADIYFEEEIEEFQPVVLTLRDLQTVEQRFGIRITEEDTTTFNFYDALTMTLKVKLSRDTWLRSKKNPTMDIQFTGDLDVQKTAGSDAQVFGSIQVIPERSRIVQFGRSFQIKRGALTYNGPIEDPILDIEAEYAIRAWRNPDNEVTITMTATGQLDDLDVALSSDPAMELTDIVSYIAFGRPASESLHLGGSGAGGSLATDIALGQIANLIESVAGSGLGLDVVEIEQQGLDARLTAGKYIHRRVYLSISQPLSLNESSTSTTVGSAREITAEFELLESLLLRLLSRRETISVNLLWQYAY